MGLGIGFCLSLKCLAVVGGEISLIGGGCGWWKWVALAVGGLSFRFEFGFGYWVLELSLNCSTVVGDRP